MAHIYPLEQPSACTVVKDGRIFTLTIKGDRAEDPHILNPYLIKSLLEALESVKSHATDASVLITTADGTEYFTEGFDIRYAKKASSNADCRNRYNEMINLFKKVVSELISFPMPTIAAINGQASGAGLMLALSHDYIYIRPEPPSLLLTALDTRVTLPEYFTALIRAKMGPGAQSKLALKGWKFRPQHVEEMGIEVENLGLSQTPLEAAKKMASEINSEYGKVYAENRKNLYPELCRALGLTFTPVLPSKL